MIVSFFVFVLWVILPFGRVFAYCCLHGCGFLLWEFLVGWFVVDLVFGGGLRYCLGLF